MAVTISLLNMKGGVGKTVLAVNLAWHLYSVKKKRVLLIDLDPQFNASQYMMDFQSFEDHLRKHGTIADILIDQPVLRLGKPQKKIPDKNRIARLKQATGRYLDFLPSQLELAHVVKNPSHMEFRLEKLLSSLRKNYDYIFIDCAPTDSVLTTMALTASNYVLIPIRPDRFSILGYANLLKTIQRFKDESNDPNNVRALGLVFTQVSGSSPLEQRCMNDITAVASEHSSFVFTNELPFSRTIIRAVQEQTPIYETRFARDELKSSIGDIVNEMIDRIAELEAEELDL